jgi:hypothetical protein
MTDQIPPPPPPPSPAARPNYILFALLGIIVGLLIVVGMLVLTRGDDAASDTSAGADPTVAAPTTVVETTLAATTTVAAEPTTTLEQFVGDTVIKVADGDPFGTFNWLSDVRFQQREEGFTRIVFDFEPGDVPWWTAEYTAGPFSSIGDEPIPVAGTDFLRIVLSSTTYDLTGAEVRITYDGPERIAANTNSVTEVVLIDSFEGVSEWVIGVNGNKPFAVGTLTNPPRVYVDIGD